MTLNLESEIALSRFLPGEHLLIATGCGDGYGHGYGGGYVHGYGDGEGNG